MSSIIQNILFVGKLEELALTCDYNRGVTFDLTSAFNSLTILGDFSLANHSFFNICSLMQVTANIKQNKTSKPNNN